jgi:acyl carrier protein
VTIHKNDIINLIKDMGLLIDTEKLVSDKPLAEQGIDSLDMINIFFKLEENFKIKISEEDIEKIKTIDDIVEYVNLKS